MTLTLTLSTNLPTTALAPSNLLKPTKPFGLPSQAHKPKDLQMPSFGEPSDFFDENGFCRNIYCGRHMSNCRCVGLSLHLDTAGENNDRVYGMGGWYGVNSFTDYELVVGLEWCD